MLSILQEKDVHQDYMHLKKNWKNYLITNNTIYY
uniref:Uncharacterized protein n=1 Tax=CrAss-like virus sp. ctYsL76 TaxID=2826826 RepID=A0A8S5QLK4_9CAUD|nr:MAG TPA: hypothetical protein [CrAss-like virus sp. ctYsL76]